MTEWVQPGLAPSHRCDWHGSDGLHLPAEYAEWASVAAGPAVPVANIAAAAAPSDSAGRFRIVAPRDGDRYEVPPGVDRRYATLALRAGGAGAANVRWYVDGRSLKGGRWPLTPGAHRIRAEGSGGARDEVGIEVR
jgi:membrane carboxypeptidase/penicillin-binding protein PbpC